MDIIYLILTNLRRLLKNKKLLTLIILLFLLLNLFSLFNNVFAVSSGQNHSFSFDYNGTTYNITYCNRLDNKSSPYPTYFVLFDKQTNKPYRIIYHHQGQNFKYYYNSSGNLVIQKINNDCYFYVDLTSSNENNFTFGYQDLKYNRSDLTIDSSRYAIPYSSKPILNKDTNEEYKEFVWNDPSITTSVNSFKYWNFNNVEINGGTFDLNKGDMEFIVNYYNDIGSSEDSPFQKYETSTKIKLDKSSLFVNINEEDGQAFFTASIPRSELLKNVNIRNGAYIDIGLHGSYWASDLPNGEITCDIVESGISLVLNSNYEEDLQKEKESQQRQELIDNQKETNEKLDENNKKLEETNNNIKDTNDFLKNDNVPDDNEFNLPSVEVNDPTANFFDTMFMGLYNAINVEGNQQISFKIFSKDIVINSDDFNFLVGNEWAILRIILTSSWVFGIGIFILKDIRKMIDKIKSGNIESVASDDIKADMV